MTWVSRDIFCHHHIKYHIVWIPKISEKNFVKGVKEYVGKIYRISKNSISLNQKMKLSVQLNHVHVVIVIPRELQLPVLFSSSCHSCQKNLRRNFFLRETYASKEGIWTQCHCVLCIGLKRRGNSLRNRP